MILSLVLAACGLVIFHQLTVTWIRQQRVGLQRVRRDVQVMSAERQLRQVHAQLKAEMHREIDTQRGLIAGGAPTPGASPQGFGRGHRLGDWGLAIGLLIVGALLLGPVGTFIGEQVASTIAMFGGSSGPLVTPAKDSGWRPRETDIRGGAIRWDPCIPVRVGVDPVGAPYPEFAQDVQQVLSEISTATSSTWPLVGNVDANTTPFADRTATEGAQVIVRWSDDASLDDLAGQTSAHTSKRGGVIQTVAADVTLAPSRTWMTREQWRGVIRHELGHVVGLGHVDDPTQVMNRSVQHTEWPGGDLAGLAALGGGAGCLPTGSTPP